MTIQDSLPLPPKAAGKPILGNALDMRGDIAQFYVDLYREYGEIVRIESMKRESYVMSGVAVNNWFVDNQHLFDISGAWKSVEMIWGTRTHILLHDGPVHQRLRSTVRRSMATGMVARQFDLLRSHLHDVMADWHVGQELKVWGLFQRLVTDQLSLLIVNETSGDLFPHLRRLITWQLYVDLARALPDWTLKTPMYQHSVRKVRAFLQRIIEQRRLERAQNPDAPERDTLTDDLLDAQAEDPAFWSDEAVVAALSTPFLAGMDTVASTLSFLIYALLKHPEAQAACQAEVDQLYGEHGDSFGYNELRKLQAVPGLVHETLRLYPIGVSATRVAQDTFAYNGYRVPAGSFVFLPTVVPHFLEEYYPDPMRFDIRREKKPPVKGAFAPFSLGAHTCLGAGFGQAQLLATMVMLLRHVEFELVSPDFEMQIQSTPVPNPGRDFKIRLKRFRQRQAFSTYDTVGEMV